MKSFFIYFISILSLNATDAIVYAIGHKGDVLPAAAVTVKLDIHGIDNLQVWANGVSIGTVKYPYLVSFTSLPSGQTNLIVVASQDFMRRATTNTFEMISRERTFNKRK